VIKALKGFKDILPGETPTWQRVESLARDVFARFGFREIRLPILEKTELFARSIGEATDIVEKEMYTFTDRNGESVTMRPEGTASLLRAFIEHRLDTLAPLQKLYTIGPMFRHERPQKGRLRQFHQLSVEAIGSGNPRLDAEVISMGRMFLDELKIEAELEINSLGCAACRPGYRAALVGFLEQRKASLCGDCQRRTTTNPLRVLDCKNPSCREALPGAPSILDHLCPDCTNHFAAVRRDLDLTGTAYTVNPRMVRGLDYYSRTTFEFTTSALGAQSAVGAGGRYDQLVAQLGGPDLPGVGFAMGMERLVLLLNGEEQPTASTDLFVASLGGEAAGYGFQIVQKLRSQGFSAACDHEGRGLKSQMKQADRSAARFVLIIGEEELARGQGILRNMASREQSPLPLDLGDVAATAARIAPFLRKP